MPMPNVVTSAMAQCSFGVSPVSLMAVPKGAPVVVENLPPLTTMDHLPIANIPPFGMCSSPANPTVIAATAAAMGVLTPMPCVPNTPAPWVPGAVMTTVNGAPALTAGSTCNCVWGGVITVLNPGATRTMSG